MKQFKSFFRALRPIFGKTHKTTKPILSCVVDQNPKFLMQCWVWLVSAKKAGAFEDCHVIIHHVGPVPDVLQQAADRFGAKVVEIESFGAGAARYCNKLQSHQPILSTKMSGAILTDVDLFFFDSPAGCWSPTHVRAKIVDRPNPPENLLSSLADILGLPALTYEGVPTFSPETRTHALNCNGGLYALPMGALQTLSPLWYDYASKCLLEEDVLGRWLHHADQIGFMMSMAKTAQAFSPLDLNWNFPTHFKPDAYAGVNADHVKIFHYHNKLSPEGRLLPITVPEIDGKIEQANAILSAYENLPEYKIIQAQYAASLK